MQKLGCSQTKALSPAMFAGSCTASMDGISVAYVELLAGFAIMLDYSPG